MSLPEDASKLHLVKEENKETGTETGEEESENLSMETMTDILKNGAFTDLTIVVEGKKVQFHKVIFAGRSEFFAASLKRNFKEGCESMVEIKECSYDGFMKMCEHIYDDNAKLEYGSVFILMELADKFGVTHLKKRLECEVVKYITIDNAAKIFKYANRYNFDRLRNICLMYIDEHYSTIVYRRIR